MTSQSEEITYLSGLFLEYGEVISDSRAAPQLLIKFRPCSKDLTLGYEDNEIESFLLEVICLPGDPEDPGDPHNPKLQITPEKGFTTTAAKVLRSLLEEIQVDNLQSQVMICNLVEASQEVLIEILMLFWKKIISRRLDDAIVSDLRAPREIVNKTQVLF